MNMLPWKTQQMSPTYLLNNKNSMETTGGNSSRINGKNEGQKRSIHNILRIGLIESNKHANKWFYALETQE